MLRSRPLLTALAGLVLSSGCDDRGADERAAPAQFGGDGGIATDGGGGADEQVCSPQVDGGLGTSGILEDAGCRDPACLQARELDGGGLMGQSTGPAGGTWDCVGRYHWPDTSGEPTSTEVITVRGGPEGFVRGATITACPGRAFPCAEPTDEVQFDSTDIARLRVPASGGYFEGYFRVDGDLVPIVWVTNFPIAVRLGLNVSASFRPLGGDFNPTSLAASGGPLIVGGALDCRGVAASGIRAEVSSLHDRFEPAYFEGFSWSGRGRTSSSGLFLARVTPGPVRVRLVHERSCQVVSEIEVIAGPREIVALHMLPAAAP